MTKITILGAGITGLAIASQLPLDAEITIVGRNLPGDEPTKEFASQWAAAAWIGVHDSSERDQKMQLDAYKVLWRLAETNPESGLIRGECTEIMGTGSRAQVWYQDKVHGFRFLAADELPAGASYGMKFMSVSMNPTVFIGWMRARLERRGVRFQRATVASLADVAGLAAHDVLINASGLGAASLRDVRDATVKPVRLQSLLLRIPSYRGLFVRRGQGYYSNAFARGDGTVYVGGVFEYDNADLGAYDDLRQMIIERAHENQPDVFPSTNLADYDVVGDIATNYPGRRRQDGGNRVEKEVVGGQRVVHAYGQYAGGFVNSFGVAREVAKLVDEYVFDASVPAKL